MTAKLEIYRPHQRAENRARGASVTAVAYGWFSRASDDNKNTNGSQNVKLGTVNKKPKHKGTTRHALTPVLDCLATTTCSE